MSRQIQLRRGTAAEHENFTGAPGELTVDTTNNTLRVHDGETPGGHVVGTGTGAGAALPTGADYVIESQLPTAENNYTWYRKYASGRVDIGGNYTGNAKTVSLPITLQDTNYIILLTKNSTPAYWATTHVAISSRTTTSFSVATYGDTASIKIGWQILNAMCA